MSIIAKRRRIGAVCPKCKSPDYSHKGKVFGEHGKHEFKCNSCGNFWQYGTTESIYTALA